MTERGCNTNAPGGGEPPAPAWQFRLYVAGMTPAGEAARANLAAVCDQCLAGRYAVEVVDLLAEPARAEADRIFAIPAALRIAPAPEKRVIGDLSDRRRVLAGLGIPEASGRPPDPGTGPSGV